MNISGSLDSNRSDAGTVFSPNAFKVPYLGVDGAFTIDTKDISASDPRNPKRVVFQGMELFSFYKDIDGKTPLAQNCRYVTRVQQATHSITHTSRRHRFGICSS